MDEESVYDTYRFWTMSVAEYLDEFFEHDLIKADLAGSGIIGTAPLAIKISVFFE